MTSRAPRQPCGWKFCPAATRMVWACDDIPVMVKARIAGCSSSTNYRRGRVLGCVGDPRRKFSTIPARIIRSSWTDTTKSLGELAVELGIEKRAIYVRAKQLGLPPRKGGRRRSVTFPDNFAVMWLAGVKGGDIATLCGCTRSLVGIEAQRRGLPKRPRRSRKAITLAQFGELMLRVRMKATTERENNELSGL